MCHPASSTAQHTESLTDWELLFLEQARLLPPLPCKCPSFPSPVLEERRALPRHLHMQNCLVSMVAPSARARRPSRHSLKCLVCSSLRRILDFTASSSIHLPSPEKTYPALHRHHLTAQATGTESGWLYQNSEEKPAWQKGSELEPRLIQEHQVSKSGENH